MGVLQSCRATLYFPLDFFSKGFVMLLRNELLCIENDQNITKRNTSTQYCTVLCRTMVCLPVSVFKTLWCSFIGKTEYYGKHLMVIEVSHAGVVNRLGSKVLRRLRGVQSPVPTMIMCPRSLLIARLLQLSRGLGWDCSAREGKNEDGNPPTIRMDSFVK